MIFISNLINESKTGSDKQETYRTLLSRHKLAMKHGFYFEALLIDYAMLEDRLVAFLWRQGYLTMLTNSDLVIGGINHSSVNYTLHIRAKTKRLFFGIYQLKRI